MDILEVINELKEYLFQKPLRERIAKIILFGSYAKRVQSKESDIDILILTTNGKDLEKEILEEIHDFMVEKNLPIEVFVDSIGSLYPLKDYFIYNVSKHGLEVYSMEKSKIKMEMAKSLLGLAEEYLESAEEILERGRLRIAIDSAYNSTELCAKAFILLKEDDLPGSHGGVVSLFGKLYIKTGEIDKEIGRKLNIALELRNKARYKPNEIFTKDDALEVINLARTLIEALSEKL